MDDDYFTGAAGPHVDLDGVRSLAVALLNGTKRVLSEHTT
jgi:hypothetical protein